MSKKGKVINFNFKKDVSGQKPLTKPTDSSIVDLRKNNIFKMVEDLASLNHKDEDLLEG